MSVYVKAIPSNENMAPGECRTIATWAQRILVPTRLAREFAWTQRGAYRILVYDGKKPVSVLTLFERAGLFDDRPVRIGGVGSVMTPPEYRGQGYAGLALEEAQRVIFGKLQAQMGLLFCEDHLVPFYIPHGWYKGDCPVTIEQPAGHVIWPYCTMILAKPGEEWKPQAIDLCGLPW